MTTPASGRNIYGTNISESGDVSEVYNKSSL
jgi:hypothetical protein